MMPTVMTHTAPSQARAMHASVGLAHRLPGLMPHRQQQQKRVVLTRFKEKSEERLEGNEVLDQERGRAGTIEGSPAQASVGYGEWPGCNECTTEC